MASPAERFKKATMAAVVAASSIGAAHAGEAMKRCIASDATWRSADARIEPAARQYCPGLEIQSAVIDNNGDMYFFYNKPLSPQCAPVAEQLRKETSEARKRCLKSGVPQMDNGPLASR